MSTPSSSSKLILFRYLHHHHRSSISSTPIPRFTNPSISSTPYSSLSSKLNSWVGSNPNLLQNPCRKTSTETILTRPKSSVSSKLNSWVGSKPGLFQNPCRNLSKSNSWVGSKPDLLQNPCRKMSIEANLARPRSSVSSKLNSWVGSKPGLFQNPCRKMSTETNLARPRSSVSSNLNSWVGSKPGLLQNPCQKVLTEVNLTRNLMGLRYVSTKGKNLGSKLDGGLLKGRIKEHVLNAFVKYKQAVGLQMDAFWKRNSLVLVGAGGVLVCILLWRVMFGIANTFVGLSEGMAKYGFLALSSAIVAFAGLYLRSRFTINPDKVYRMAMRKLNTSADILEIMGAPLTGTDLRAYVMSGGGITLKNFKAGLRSKRCFLIFPIRGAEMKGLVSVEVKNKRGQYDMKLLSVDLPMATGPDQRLFLIGDEEEYRVGGGLISELRDPVVKAMAAAKEFEARDIEEDKEDARRELEDAERQHREEVEKIQREGS